MMLVSLSPFTPENLVSRDRFGRPVPRQLVILYIQAGYISRIIYYCTVYFDTSSDYYCYSWALLFRDELDLSTSKMRNFFQVR